MAILWLVFHILTEPFPYTFVNRRNGEAWTHIAIWARPTVHHFVDLRIENGVVKIWKMRHKISVNIRIFFTVYKHAASVLPPGESVRVYARRDRRTDRQTQDRCLT